MAVFLVNVCKFNNCGLTFPSLSDLIQHIESTHIGQSLPDIDEPSQSICLPFSYVQPYVPMNYRHAIYASRIAEQTTGNGTGDQGTTTEGIGAVNAPTSVRSVTPVSTASTAPNQPASPEDHTGIQSGPSAGDGSSISIGAGGTRTSADFSSGSGSSAGAGAVSSGPSLPSTSTNGTATATTESTSKAVATGNSQNSGDLKRRMAVKAHHTYSMSSSNRSTTPTGSEMDDDDMMGSESEDSNDSWTTEEFSSEFIMRYGSRRVSTSSGHGINVANEKPFACPVPGCKKRYKNVNGIKYHSKNGHKKDGNRVRKGFKCFCGKSYKTSVRLRNHNLIAHPQGTSGDSIMTAAQQPAPTTNQPALVAASSSSPVLYATGLPVSLTLSQTASFATNSTGASGQKPTSPHSNHHAPAVNSSSQIIRNTTSPTALSITQQLINKIHANPRIYTNSSSSSISTTTATTTVAATGTAVAIVSTIASSPGSGSSSTATASANIGNSAGSCNGLPTTGGGAGFSSSTIMHSVAAAGSSIKYDNLGILTPATSPKLMAAVSASDSGGGSHAHPTNPSHLGVIVPTTNGGGASPSTLGGGGSNGSASKPANNTTVPASAGSGGGQLTTVGANGGPSPVTNGGGSGGGTALCEGGVDGTLGIALVVSNMVGEQLNIGSVSGNAGNGSGTGGTAGGGGTVVLSASPATSQLYGEGT